MCVVRSEGERERVYVDVGVCTHMIVSTCVYTYECTCIRVSVLKAGNEGGVFRRTAL